MQSTRQGHGASDGRQQEASSLSRVRLLAAEAVALRTVEECLELMEQANEHLAAIILNLTLCGTAGRRFSRV